MPQFALYLALIVCLELSKALGLTPRNLQYNWENKASVHKAVIPDGMEQGLCEEHR